MKGEISILGERRVSRFDPHLAERIEAWDRELTIKEEAEKRRQELEARLKPKDENARPDAKKNANPKVSSIDDFLVIPDIRCVGADDIVFEKYDKIYIVNDIDREGSRYVNFTPYKAISHFEKNNWFLPSFALSCNILACLFANRDDEDANKALMLYKDHGAGYGWHAQNTIIDWKERKIRHYPLDADFPKYRGYGGNDDINQSRQRKEFEFKAKGFGVMALEDALKEKHFKKFIINLTGLPDPNVLVEIGRYFGKPARIWVPNAPSEATYTSASWLGCSDYSFGIYANDYLDYSSAACGVREP